MNKDDSIAIAIMARDCEKKLLHNIPKIMNLAQHFKSVDICVVENDSVDNTKQILKDWAEQNSFITIISLDNVFSDSNIKGTGKSRIERLTYCRNQYLKFFYEKKIAYDYLFVIDIDINDFDVESIISGIEQAPSDWFGLFPNGIFYNKIFGKTIKGRYYDLYAYLPYESKHEDLIEFEFRLYNDEITTLLQKNEYQLCDSAFGGIGIYKFSELNNRYYQAEKNNRSPNHYMKCEHISFNRIPKESKKRNYIASNMIVLYDKMPLWEIIFRKIFSQKKIIRMNSLLHLK